MNCGTYLSRNSVTGPVGKYFYRRGLVTIVALSLGFEAARAQVNNATVAFQFSLPQGEYRQTYPRTASGFLFDFVHQTKQTSFTGIGAEIGFMQVSGDNDQFTGYYHNNYNEYYSSSYNYIFSLAAKLRFNLLDFKNSGKIFTDLSVGTNVFFTHATISHNKQTILSDITDFPSELKTDSSAIYNCWTLKTGVGLGTEIPFGHKKQLSIALKFSYLYGSHARYFARPAVNDAQIILSPIESNTSMFLAEAGICFKIRSGKSAPLKSGYQ